MKKLDYIQLSKEISYALRHAPWEYELELDKEGWVPMEQLLTSFRECTQWKKLDKEDIIYMIEQSTKKRHEYKAGNIRAHYGHSTPFRIRKEEEIPPQYLYHGTTQKAVENILKSGLLPCSRQYVHLSQDVETAKEVGKRRDSNPVILVIAAEAAYNEKVKFYLGNEKVWLADFVPSKYIEKV